MYSEGGSQVQYVYGIVAHTCVNVLEDYKQCCCGGVGNTWRTRD